MNSDAYFVIGKSHEICQDYALAENTKGKEFAIVSDGCSSSEYTDFGSRLLCHNLKTTYGKENFANNPFGETIARSEVQASAIGLKEESLDATLLSIIANKPDLESGTTRIAIKIRGDGIIAFRNKDESIEIFSIGHTNNAPNYLSYDLNPDRYESYKEKFTEKMFYKEWHFRPDKTLSNENEGDIKNLMGFSTYFLNSDKTINFWADEKVKVAAVFSDGVDTFRGPDSKYLTVTEVVLKLMDIKTFKGKFTQRKMKRFLKDCAKEGIYPEDDVSMAAIYVGG